MRSITGEIRAISMPNRKIATRRSAAAVRSSAFEMIRLDRAATEPLHEQLTVKFATS